MTAADAHVQKLIVIVSYLFVRLVKAVDTSLHAGNFQRT